MSDGAEEEEKGFIRSFVDFIFKPEILDAAIAFIIAGAITAMIQSLVVDIFNPVISLFLGAGGDGSGGGLGDKYLVLKGPDGVEPPGTLADAMQAGFITWNYGRFLVTFIEFIIIGFLIFVLTRASNALGITSATGLRLLRRLRGAAHRSD